MARTSAQQRVFLDLQARYGEAVARAFFEALDDLRASAEVERVIAAYQAGNIAGAIDALHIEAEAFNGVLDRLREAYGEGGREAVRFLPSRGADGTALIVRFDGRNIQAERGIAVREARLVTGVVDNLKKVATDRMVAGLARGDNPRTVALDLVGRVNRVTGKREGGILGMTEAQAEYVASAREELASGDPEKLRNYLTRGRRDRRFDRSVLKAIREEKPVSAEIASKAVTAYERRLIQLRGETVAKHETFNAIAEAKDEAYRQAIESGKVSASAVTLTWRSFPGENPRLQHALMNGKSVPYGQPFVMADGTALRYPHDPRAPLRHTIGCECQADYRIDFLANLR